MFIEGFSHLATPMTKLTKKNMKFIWLEKCEESFLQLKKKLVSAPILALPESGKQFTMYSDALIQGLGCVVMHDGWVITYASHQLKLHKRK